MSTLTKDGFARFTEEHGKLLKDRVSALQDMVRMRELGDLSENAGYRASRSKLRRIDSRIRFLDKLLRTSRVIHDRVGALRHISIGTSVQLKEGAEVFEYRVVDSVESDIVRGRISARSPLGRALLGKRRGELVHVKTPSGTRSLVVISFKD